MASPAIQKIDIAEEGSDTIRPADGMNRRVPLQLRPALPGQLSTSSSPQRTAAASPPMRTISRRERWSVLLLITVLHAGGLYMLAHNALQRKQPVIQPAQALTIALVSAPAPAAPTPPEPAPPEVAPPPPQPPPPPVAEKPPEPKPEPTPPPKPKPKPTPKPKPVPRPEPAPEPPQVTSAPPAPVTQPLADASPPVSYHPVATGAPATGNPAMATTTAPRHDAAYLNNPKPPYPRLSERRGEAGTVKLRVYVTEKGTAGEVQLYKSSGYPRLDQSALATVPKWRFVPAKRGNTPVGEWYIVPIIFKQ